MHAAPSTEPATVPLGLAVVTDDVTSVRRFVDRNHENMVWWHQFPVNRHYQVPDGLLAG